MPRPMKKGINANEIAKDFKGTLKKLIGYIKRHKLSFYSYFLQSYYTINRHIFQQCESFIFCCLLSL